MAAAQKAWFKIMRDHLSKMTAKVTTIASMSMTDPILQDQVSLVHALLEALRAVSSSIPRQACRIFPCTMSEHKLFISSFATLLTALVPQLVRFSSRLDCPVSSSIGTSEEAMFWELWEVLTVGCCTLSLQRNTWKDLWANGLQLFHEPLFMSFHALVAWLLPMIQSPAWLVMQPDYDDREDRDSQLMLILIEPIMFAADLSFLTTNVLVGHLQSLPPSFFPLLCCVFSEHCKRVLTAYPVAGLSIPATTKKEYEPRLVFRVSDWLRICQELIFTTIHNFTNAEEGLGAYNPVFSFLAAPAVLHTLKEMIIMYQVILLHGPTPVELYHECLQYLLNRRILHSGGQTPVVDMLAAGTLLNPSPMLGSQEQMQTDAELLHALSHHMQHNGKLMPMCYALQCSVLRSWLEAIQQCSGQCGANLSTTEPEDVCNHSVDADTLSEMPAETPSQQTLCQHPSRYISMDAGSTPKRPADNIIASSCVGMAQQCTTHGLDLMRQLWKEGRPCLQRGDRTWECLGSGAQEMHGGRTERKDRRFKEITRAVRSLQGWTVIRRLMLLSSTMEGALNPCGQHALVLRAWRLKAGWAAMIEALCRGEYHASNEADIVNVALLAWKALTLLEGSTDAPTLCACLSLAGTIRKLLQLLTPIESEQAEQERQRSWMTQPSLKRVWVKQRETTLVLINTFMPTLVAAISALSQLCVSRGGMIRVGSTGGNNSHGSESGSSCCEAVGCCSISKEGQENVHSCNRSSKSGAGWAHLACSSVQVGASRLIDSAPFRVAGDVEGPAGQHQDVSQQGAFALQHDDSVSDKGKVMHDACSTPLLIHKLQAITVLTCVQTLQWRVMCGREGVDSDSSAWLAVACQVCVQLPSQDLQDLMASLLIDSSTPVVSVSRSEVGAIWERYAVTHFHGRLTLGCCSLSCTNLEGTSEAALKTQLCSGCRGARYCSIKCQRAAWLEGGHSAVCKKT